MANTYDTERTLAGTYSCEAGGEYTLPDYTPEVRRVIRVDCDATVTGQYDTQDKTEVGGDVTYCLIYLDGDGALSSVTLDGTFSCQIPGGEGVRMQVVPTVDGVTCRLGGPRRVTMKANMTLRPIAVRSETLTEAETADLGECEILRRPLTVGETVFFEGEENDLTDSVKAEPDSRLLSVCGRVLVREAKAEVGAVRVRADLWMTALCADGSGTPYTVRGKIPVEETISEERLTPAFSAMAFGRCSACSASFANEEGSDRLVFDARVTLFGVAVNNEVVTPMCDVYALEYPISVSRAPVTGRYYPACLQGNCTVDGSMPLAELGLTEEAVPLDSRGQASVTSCTADGAEVTMEGEIRMFCLLGVPGDESYAGATFRFPWKARMTAKEPLPAGAQLMPQVQVVGCHVRSDGQKLSADAELQLSCLATATNEIEAVDGITADTEHPFALRRGEIVAAYLEGGDSLWSVGKRYHVPLGGLADANSVPREALETPDLAQHLDGLSHLMLEYD